MIVASHRGPVSFQREDDGSFTTRRGAGGVVSALAPLLRNRPDTRWIAAAIGSDDCAAVTAGTPIASDIKVELHLLDPELHRMHYDVISNRILWFLFHGLFDLPREPSFGPALHEAWDAFHAVNETFAEAIAQSAPENEVVLVQDLHLLLVPGLLHAVRPDLLISYFTHTPFCGPNAMRVLPDSISTELCASLAATATGFHSPRWARAYEGSTAEILGAGVDTAAFVSTFGPDPDELADVAAGPEVAAATASLEDRIGDRRCIVRCDRVELSKNIVRGFLAYDELLERHP
ncbi:MAG: trehalose-6-phosphate synthase, partial [Acidimicrobiia bacterium]|nr:trehalose-6-phosphate synthase [Acidimicrobiia bacterium]